jgi:hypothetical protein
MNFERACEFNIIANDNRDIWRTKLADTLLKYKYLDRFLHERGFLTTSSEFDPDWLEWKRQKLLEGKLPLDDTGLEYLMITRVGTVSTFIGVYHEVQGSQGTRCCVKVDHLMTNSCEKNATMYMVNLNKHRFI